jgi:hypothetical protein
MARGRSLSDLRNDSYKRADCEGATDRHTPDDVTRYVNQGGAELYDIIVEARGRSYFRKSPPLSITTLAGTSFYAFSDDEDSPSDFYRLISVRRQGHESLRSFTPDEEADLRRADSPIGVPTHYELRPGGIELLPLHGAGTVIVVDYVPTYTDLVEDDDTFDGINGWEEYVVCFAARCMAVKDEEWQLANALKADMASLRDRISKLAPTRDGFRPERVKDVRGSSRRWPNG